MLMGENRRVSLEEISTARVIDSYCAIMQPALQIRSQLLKEIKEIHEPSQHYVDLVQEAQEKRPIMVHLRQGDYQKLTHLFGPLLEPWITQLLRELLESHPAPIWVFSDSPVNFHSANWRGLRIDRLISSQELPRPIENLVLMSHGIRLICSNSTFSWWAAFLSESNCAVHYPSSDLLKNKVFNSQTILQGWVRYEVG
jgi:hypothetical protein